MVPTKQSGEYNEGYELTYDNTSDDFGKPIVIDGSMSHESNVIGGSMTPVDSNGEATIF